MANSNLDMIYGKLRASLLARHFALAKYFRADHLALWNHIGSVHNPGSATSIDQDDLTITDWQRWIVEPSTFEGARDLFAKLRAGTLTDEERWRVARFERENPLMLTGQLLTCLAVEHHLELDRTGATRLISRVLATLASLCKFHQGHFLGYILRWDPVTSDVWATEQHANAAVPKYCCEFLVNPDGSYDYCTSFSDPRYTPALKQEQINRLSEQARGQYSADHLRFRAWEPSTDELVGLVMGYFMVWKLVDDPGIRSEVRRQVSNLGDYLAEHGYLLVRPRGGFAARGAAGFAPAVEFPFGQVFERITGNRYASRSSFEDALARAGVWDLLEGPLRTFTALGAALDVVLTLLAGAVATSALARILIGGFGSTLGLGIGALAGRALAIYAHPECFDVSGDPQDQAQGEFALAYLLKQAPADLRFKVALWWLQSQGGHARGFPTPIGATALDDDDHSVRDAFLDWYRARSRAGVDHDDEGAASPVALAVAVLLGSDQDDEVRLLEVLNSWSTRYYDAWTPGDRPLTAWVQDLPLEESRYADYAGGSRAIPEVREAVGPGLAFMTALALAWLHSRRRADAGRPIPPGLHFPAAPPTAATWPEPTIPKAVVNAGNTILPRDGVPGGETLSDDIPLFSDTGEPAKPSQDPTVQLKPESAKQTVLVRDGIVVRESDRDPVDTQVDVLTEDTLLFRATGEIWAGVWMTGTNGPEGWNRIDHDRKFPLHEGDSARPYSLLARIGNEEWAGWMYVGQGTTYTHYPPASGGRLYLRINDDTPGNGSGQFVCRIEVKR